MGKNKATMVDPNVLQISSGNEQFATMEAILNSLRDDKEYMGEIMQMQKEDMKKLSEENRQRAETIDKLRQEFHEAKINALNNGVQLPKNDLDGWGMLGTTVGSLVSDGIKGLAKEQASHLR